MSQTKKALLVDPLVDNNPITLQVLGICSALAVTSSLRGVSYVNRSGSSHWFFIDVDFLSAELYTKFNTDYCANGNNSFTGNTR
jgi:hypothetical protein